MKLTKIIASIGPKSWDKETLQEMADNGLNIARFNFSHAEFTKTKEILEIIEDLNNEGYSIATMLDTKGPEIRTGVTDKPLSYKKGEKFLITVDKNLEDMDGKLLFCDYEYLVEDITIGDEIIIDSGNFVVTVLEKRGNSLLVKANNDAIVSSKRHINLPGVALRLPAITEKDKKDLVWGIEQGMDIVAASFIRTGAHVEDIRAYLKEHGGGHIPIIAKIENQEGLMNLEEIVETVDGIMIARGDLGVEVAIEELPTYQRFIWEVCRKHGKPVIYATELLKNMINYPFPTRSEVSDVYNAAVMGHDALMLSDETAVGKYPVESVEMLNRIANRAEGDEIHDHEDFLIGEIDSYWVDKKYSIRSAHFLAEEVGAKGIVLFTQSGFFARLGSAYQTNVPLYSFTPNKKTISSLSIYYGVYPFFLEEGEKIEYNEKGAIKLLLEKGYISGGEKVVIAYDGEIDGKRVAQIKIVSV